MVVIALATNDLHRTPTQTATPTMHDLPTTAGAAKSSLGLDPGPMTPPASASITTDTSRSTLSPPTPDEPEAGPSTRSSPQYGGISSHAQIPPPPNPRRHRSGVLMSRVRAHSGNHPVAAGMSVSKSWGELSSLGLGMSSMAQGKDREVEGDDEAEDEDGKSRRSFSEGIRSRDEDAGMWDNSARFYHHMHSRPASRSTSPTRSPTSPPGVQSQASPIYVRRLTLPDNGPGPPPSIHMSASLSPSHHFLQAHLPPAFPQSGSSPESNLLDPPGHHMVILTPTTQEWRELKEIGRLSGEEIDSDSASSGYDTDQRSVDLGNGVADSMLVEGKLDRPRMRKVTMSADYLEPEHHHSPDPGGRENSTPERPMFTPVIIAPSPIIPSEARIPSYMGASGKDSQFGFNVNDDDGSEDDSPVLYNSIGRKSSLRALKQADEPRVKTKRELEREKLFRMVDESYEKEEAESKNGSYGVREIGSGAGLGARPSSANAVLQGRSTEDEPKQKASTLPVAPKPSISPTQPMKPSPLQASPVTALDGLPSPAETPDSESEMNFKHYIPSLASQTSRFDSIRQYSRALSSHHHLPPKSAPSSAPSSPPRSPRSPRRRDTSRVSLVAGRVVQPFAYPPSTALPPGLKPTDSIATKKPSLQSFSPFKAPVSPLKSPSQGGPLHPPHFPRFDSTISFAPSTGVPSECGTPTSETAGGVGGRGIDDYVILKEAGKGAYGLVMRARVKGPKGEPVGDEVIIKYIIKARILADCWKKHKVLGPIPVEIHVMDQLRHLMYHPPTTPHPWHPTRTRSAPPVNLPSPLASPKPDQEASPVEINSPDSMKSAASANNSQTQKILAAEMKGASDRGHPNICKLLDFFEDREFYYLVMPRFGTGVDLFDRVESQPLGLEPFEVRSLIGQLADAVRFLHMNGIVHRDIKDENVILDGEGRCQLIDFGSAAHWRPGKRWDTFSGTLHYASPEILRGEMYGGKEQDVWALGVVGYVLLVGETPFSDLPDEVIEGLVARSRAETALEERCDGQHADDGVEADGGGRLSDAADLIRRCLEMEVGDRPPAEAILNHRYLKGNGGWTGRKGWVKA